MRKSGTAGFSRMRLGRPGFVGLNSCFWSLREWIGWGCLGGGGIGLVFLSVAVLLHRPLVLDL